MIRQAKSISACVYALLLHVLIHKYLISIVGYAGVATVHVRRSAPEQIHFHPAGIPGALTQPRGDKRAAGPRGQAGRARAEAGWGAALETVRCRGAQ
eukprot:COSAG05_NODE_3009_length_2418_cov_1.500216_3_plen_97_part_00